MPALEIQKFGGTSMADAAAVKQSASVVLNRSMEEGATLVVVSAMSGVTTHLQRAIDMGLGLREGNYRKTFEIIGNRYDELIDQLVETRQSGPLHQLVEEQLGISSKRIDSMRDLESRSARWCDWILSVGERLMAPIFAAHLQASGLDVKYYDASGIITTDGNYGNANPNLKKTRGNVYQKMLEDLRAGKIGVMGGYYGGGVDGNITVFSRGGSDLSATFMGSTLGTFIGKSVGPFFDPIEVHLYKADVAGVLSANPRIVNEAHLVPHMRFEEAAALAAIGGNIIHPKAVHQAVGSEVSKLRPFPIHIRSTLDPESAGTIIDYRDDPNDNPIKAVSVINSAVRLTVSGWGMDRPGIMKGITGVLSEMGVDIDMIGQPYSKLSLDLAFQHDGNEQELEETVKRALNREITQGDIDIVETSRVGIVGVIGKGLSDPYNLRRVIDGMNGDFPELRESDANQLIPGKFEVSIRVDLPQERLYDLVRSIHHSVFS